MAKRKISPERREQRKKLLEMLQDSGINDMPDMRYQWIAAGRTDLKNYQ